ncbi:MAG: dockerin type I repeat-containing protein [Oscillospiraceae bacterium]|nr:dockerin type I repeat-containing protein [Oscillospiraceae bacterium]
MDTKKIIIAVCGLLTVLLCLFAGFSSSAAATFLTGDVNSDETVDAADARLILRYVAKIQDFDIPEGFPADKVFGDVTGDGVVDAADARMVLRYVAKLITRFDIPDVVVEDITTTTAAPTTTQAASTTNTTSATEATSTTSAATETTTETVTETTTSANWFLPEDLRAYINGNYYLKGIVDHKDEIEIAVKDNEYSFTFYMRNDPVNIDLEILKKINKNIFGKDTPTIYIICSDNKTFYKSTGPVKFMGYTFDFEEIFAGYNAAFERDSVPSETTTEKISGKNLTCYKFDNPDGSYIKIYMDGDKLVSREKYNIRDFCESTLDFITFDKNVGNRLNDPKSRGYKENLSFSLFLALTYDGS